MHSQIVLIPLPLTGLHVPRHDFTARINPHRSAESEGVHSVDTRSRQVNLQPAVAIVQVVAEQAAIGRKIKIAIVVPVGPRDDISVETARNTLGCGHVGKLRITGRAGVAKDPTVVAIVIQRRKEDIEHPVVVEIAQRR
mgnify:CR=1 FL=1